MDYRFASNADFEKHLVSEYLRYGSIDQVFKLNQYNLPISYAGYHRVLDKFGVIKSAGPNSKISESLYLLTLMANYKIPLEKIYRKYAPTTIKVSTNTLHRILHCVRLGLTRRQGVALLIENKTDKGKYLVGSDISLNNSVLGERGDLSLPMSHSKLGEDPRLSILRVLQQEVFTQSVLTHNFPVNIVPEHPKPVLYINIADIRVSVYKITIGSSFKFSSHKLKNHSFMDLNKISTSQTRPGVVEIISNFEEHKDKNPNEVIEIDSNLNTNLLAYSKISSN